MNKTLLPVFLFVLTMGKLPAQNNIKANAGWMDRFHSFNTVQVLNGSTTTSFAINTVNGFQYGKLFTGIGTGFDYYYHTSVPLFLEARLNVAERKGKLQLFGNGGLSFPFSSQNKRQEFKTGPYKAAGLYAAGLDYLVPVKKEALILGVAFSSKQIIQMVDNNVWNPMLNRIENNPIKDKYSLNRIAIRLGWVF